MLAITILTIAMVQMSFFALTPAIQKIKAEVFTDLSLSQIQTAISLPSLLSMFSSILSAMLISKNILSKKATVVLGLFFMTLTGVASLLFHSSFWHLIALSILIGAGMGMFIPSTASILFDSFDENEKRILSGYQTSFINLGGIILSALGGFLIAKVWYGGYLTMLITFPIMLLSIITIPKDRSHAPHPERTSKKKTKLPADVFYYGALMTIFMLIYNVSGSNLAVHLAHSGINNAATIGVVSSLTMAGGVFSGLFFSKLSVKYKDYLIAFAYLTLFVGFTVLNLGHRSLALMIAGVFVVGMSMSFITPQCLLSVSNIVDPSNSSDATSVMLCLAPGIGGFLSPIVFTNITTLLGGDSTNFRYQFVGLLSLVLALIVAYNTFRRNKVKEEAAFSSLAGSKE